MGKIKNENIELQETKKEYVVDLSKVPSSKYLNVRSEPNKNSQIVGELENKKNIKTNNIPENGFLQIGKNKYVDMNFIKTI